MHKIHPAHFTKVRVLITILVLAAPIHWILGAIGGLLWIWIEEEV